MFETESDKIKLKISIISSLFFDVKNVKRRYKRKFMIFTDSKNQLKNVLYEIKSKYCVLYPNEEELEIICVQDQDLYDLDLKINVQDLLKSGDLLRIIVKNNIKCEFKFVNENSDRISDFKNLSFCGSNCSLIILKKLFEGNDSHLLHEKFCNNFEKTFLIKKVYNEYIRNKNNNKRDFFFNKNGIESKMTDVYINSKEDDTNNNYFIEKYDENVIENHNKNFFNYNNESNENINNQNDKIFLEKIKDSNNLPFDKKAEILNNNQDKFLDEQKDDPYFKNNKIRESTKKKKKFNSKEKINKSDCNKSKSSDEIKSEKKKKLSTSFKKKTNNMNLNSNKKKKKPIVDSLEIFSKNNLAIEVNPTINDTRTIIHSHNLNNNEKNIECCEIDKSINHRINDIENINDENKHDLSAINNNSSVMINDVSSVITSSSESDDPKQKTFLVSKIPTLKNDTYVANENLSLNLDTSTFFSNDKLERIIKNKHDFIQNQKEVSNPDLDKKESKSLGVSLQLPTLNDLKKQGIPNVKNNYTNDNLEKSFFFNSQLYDSSDDITSSDSN